MPGALTWDPTKPGGELSQDARTGGLVDPSGNVAMVVTGTSAEVAAFHSLVSGAGIGSTLGNSSNQSLLARSADGSTKTGSVSASGLVCGSVPSYYRTALGDVSRLNAGTFLAAVGYSGKRVAFDGSGNVWKLIEGGDGWTQVATAALPGVAGYSVWYADSRGYLYYGASGAGGNRALYRSVDDGTNWAQCLVFTGSTDEPGPICEDDLGNMYAGAYGSSSGGSVGFNNGLALNSRKVYKSTDGGVNWTEISSAFPTNGGGFTGPAGIGRHIHGCWWDNDRKLLFVTHGDSGAQSPIYVSADRGSTFSVWAGSAQATAMAFTPSNVLYAADQSTERGVYRCACTSISGLLAGTATKCFDWRSDAHQSSSGGSSGVGNGFAWQAYSENGVVGFPFGLEGTRASLIATADSGDTWTEVDTRSSASQLFHEQSQTSPFNTGRDGFRYGRDSTDGRLYQWGLFTPGTTASINQSATSRGSGVVAARSEPLQYGIRSPGLIQSLAAAFTSPIVLPQYSVLLAAGFQAGAVGASPSTFENADAVAAPTMPSGFTLSTGGTGTAVVTSASQAYSGTNSIKSECTAGTGNSQFRLTTPPWASADGAEAWVSSRVYFAGTIGANRQDLIEFNSVRVGLAVRGTTKTIAVFNSTLSLYFSNQSDADYVVIPENTWFRMKAAISLSPNSAGGRRGRIRVWVDVGSGWRMVCDALGVPTYSSIGTNLWLGLNQPAGAGATAAYFDNVRYGTTDPDRAPALTLAQSPAAVPDLGLSV